MFHDEKFLKLTAYDFIFCQHNLAHYTTQKYFQKWSVSKAVSIMKALIQI